MLPEGFHLSSRAVSESTEQTQLRKRCPGPQVTFVTEPLNRMSSWLTLRVSGTAEEGESGA